ncbi:MAG: ParB/RepB/Spo0J family partition protein [Melioribacteraceae bacterium]|nr:ParB/RepB/Spo0J family partition protein [Melioribacteraceae bacterium]
MIKFIKSGTSIPQLTIQIIKKYSISYPKFLPKQKQIVSKLDALSKEIKQLEFIYKNKINRLDELKKSILENGLIQPITVRRVNKHFELISGERRLRSSKEIGLKDIPAYIIKVDTKEGMLALSLIENVQREDLNPIEIATTYRKLMVECSLSQEEIATKVGKERSTVTNSMRLLKLPNKIQQALIDATISAGHARAILSVVNESDQLAIL